MRIRILLLKIGVVGFTLLLSTVGCSRSSGSTAFVDSFDAPGTGWGSDEQDAFSRGFEEDAYIFELTSPNWFAWATPGKRFSDVTIEADIRLQAGSAEEHFGLLCRYVDEDNFYYLGISADGYYGIYRRIQGGDLEALTGDGEGMLPSPFIRTGLAANEIEILCEEDQLSLSVNGNLLATVGDDTLTEGDVGLAVGSGDRVPATIAFDNFIASQP